MGGAGSGRWAGSGSCGRESEDVPGQQFLEIYFWTLVVVGFFFWFFFFFCPCHKRSQKIFHDALGCSVLREDLASPLTFLTLVEF